MVYYATMRDIPKGHQLIVTKDQSFSLFNETYGENLHSTHGARAETEYNFIQGCELKSHVGDTLNILEVGFGTGIGFFMTLDFLKENFPGKKLVFNSLEIDRNLAIWALKDLPFTEHENYLESIGPDFYLRVILGDATLALPNFEMAPLDAIYQDPFSPKKNPTLWSTEWFSLLLKLSGPSCILSTYSASTSVRIALLKAGWAVYNRKGFSEKRASTIAKVTGETPKDLKSKLLSSAIYSI